MSRDGRPYGELHPDYYKGGNGIEPWDIIKAFKLDYWRGTAVAYLCRAGRKDPEISDLRKAYTFIGERIRELELQEQQAKEAELVTGTLPRGYLGPMYTDGGPHGSND
jgi:Protein of unknwon function (DUF3310)